MFYIFSCFVYIYSYVYLALVYHIFSLTNSFKELCYCE